MTLKQNKTKPKKNTFWLKTFECWHMSKNIQGWIYKGCNFTLQLILYHEEEFMETGDGCVVSRQNWADTAWLSSTENIWDGAGIKDRRKKTVNISYVILK